MILINVKHRNSLTYLIHLFELISLILKWNELLGDRLLRRRGGERVPNPHPCRAECTRVHWKRNGSMCRRFSR